LTKINISEKYLQAFSNISFLPQMSNKKFLKSWNDNKV